ncbi:hypothetical protein C161_27448 [Paenibacillus sp. FSL R5-192]|uniref:PIN-like domain-containing protein n=1 Tax=Paenibacillus sp. FSL R5-192 TaxID=1226754 RepID=UPI0003E2456C|nr:PIN-like domain-containing protein [Paenibacillus sp. FSL R5-192]ETT30435.1 hypothetical protein C161_27448 [Paenibacillus sp. FSL R5-192]
MRNKFSGFYPPSTEDFAKLWSECTFVFDANTLLNLYRYPKESREALINIMESIQDRIWIPHQVALEYHKHIYDEMFNQKNAYSKFEKQCSESINKLISELDKLRHSNIDSTLMKNSLEECLKTIKDDLASQLESQPELDKVKEKLSQIIQENVGDPYTKEKLEEMFIKGEERYQSKIPPGFEDQKEKKDRKTLFDGIIYKDEYGDYIYWSQILDKSKEEPIKSIILVTDDNKEDWVLEVKGEKKGPHPELIQEFKKESGNKLFYLYNSEQFLKNAENHLKLKVHLDSDEMSGAIQGIEALKRLDNESFIRNESIKDKDDFFNRYHDILGVDGEQYLTISNKMKMTPNTSVKTANVEILFNLNKEITFIERTRLRDFITDNFNFHYNVIEVDTHLYEISKFNYSISLNYLMEDIEISRREVGEYLERLLIQFYIDRHLKILHNSVKE